MKKKISLILMFMLIISSSVYADSGFNVLEFTDSVNGSSYSFNLEYEIPNGIKGEVYSIQLPFDVDINGGEYLEVIPIGNGSYDLKLLGNFKNIKGYIRGKKSVSSSEELRPVIVDGKIVKDDYPTIDYNPGQSTERDRFYKIGEIKGNIIHWEVAIGGDELGVPATSITDELGDGHRVVKESVKFEVLDHGQYNNDLVDMIVNNLEISDTEINFDIDTISPGEILYLSYDTEIIDSEQLEFSNQLIIEGEKKITQSVEVDSDSGITGETPTDPEKPPVLPQVGESIFKIEYIVAFMLIGLALTLRRDRR